MTWPWLVGLSVSLAACGAASGVDNTTPRESVSKQGTVVAIDRRADTLELAVDLTWPPLAVQTTPLRDTVLVTAHTRFVPKELRFSNLQVGDAVAVTTSSDARGHQLALVLTRLILD